MSDDAFVAALRFIIGRLRVSLLEAGHRHDVVEAVVNVKGEVPYEAQRFVEQLCPCGDAVWIGNQMRRRVAAGSHLLG